MNRSIISGPKLLVNDQWLDDHALIIEDEKIKKIIAAAEITNYAIAKALKFPQGYLCIPGLIDLHIHGAKGCDFMDADEKGFCVISQALASEGVTSFLATTMSRPIKELHLTLSALSAFAKQNRGFLGIHLEGPFLAPSKSGAQAGDALLLPDFSLFQQWQQKAEGKIKLMTLAPELPGTTDLIRLLLNEGVVIGLGHSNADYRQTEKAVRMGCNYATHLFNAMRNIHHREPGIAMQILLADSVYTEVIADGIHLHPAMLELVFRLKGRDKILLISDAIRAKCMKDGIYDLGGQAVHVQSGKATLKNGTLAGSTLTIPQAILNMQTYTHSSLIDAIHMATITPANILSLGHRKGKLCKNFDADLVVLDDRFNVVLTMRAGEIIFDTREDDHH